MSEDDDEIYLPKSDLDDYPLKRDFYQPIDALDIKKTSQTWIALVKCDSKYGVKMRFYKWKKNKDEVMWHVAWARMDIDDWDMNRITKFLAKK